MADGNPIVAGLPSVTVQWGSAISLAKKPGIDTTVLLRSSEGAWTQEGTDVQPDFSKHPEEGFAPGKDAKREAVILAVAAKGVFESGFKGKANPLFKQDDEAKGEAKPEEAKGKGGVDATSVVEKSPPSARLVVVSSGEFVRDTVLNLARQTGSDLASNNLQFVQNIVDWAVEDVDLLSIRSRGAYARTLKPMDKSTRFSWEAINYGIAFAGLVLIAGIVFARRRKLEPMALTPSGKKSKE